MLVLSINRRYAVLCGAVLSAWAHTVVEERVKRRGMERLRQRRDAQLLQGYLLTWWAVVAENRWVGCGRGVGRVAALTLDLASLASASMC